MAIMETQDSKFNEIEEMFNAMYNNATSPRVSSSELIVDTIIVVSKLYTIVKSQELRIQQLEKLTSGLQTYGQ